MKPVVDHGISAFLFKCSLSRRLTLDKGCHLIFAKTPGYVISWVAVYMEGGWRVKKGERGSSELVRAL